MFYKTAEILSTKREKLRLNGKKKNWKMEIDISWRAWEIYISQAGGFPQDISQGTFLSSREQSFKKRKLWGINLPRPDPTRDSTDTPRALDEDTLGKTDTSKLCIFRRFYTSYLFFTETLSTVRGGWPAFLDLVVSQIFSKKFLPMLEIFCSSKAKQKLVKYVT